MSILFAIFSFYKIQILINILFSYQCFKVEKYFLFLQLINLNFIIHYLLFYIEILLNYKMTGIDLMMIWSKNNWTFNN